MFLVASPHRRVFSQEGLIAGEAFGSLLYGLQYFQPGSCTSTDLDVIRNHNKGSVRRHPRSNSFRDMIRLTSFPSRKTRARESYYQLSLVFVCFGWLGQVGYFRLAFPVVLSWGILPFLPFWGSAFFPFLSFTHTQSSWMFSPKENQVADSSTPK